MTRDTTTVAEQLQNFPRGAQELSAARLARDVAKQLARAFHARGDKQQDLAKDLGVTAGAVSQVLNGDGNLRIATLGRYLRALGYEARLTLVPVDEGAPALAEPARRGPRQALNPAAAATTPCLPATIPGTAWTSWTVLDSAGDVSGVRVRVTSTGTPGLADFSGQCRVDQAWHSVVSSSGCGYDRVAGETLERHRALLRATP